MTDHFERAKAKINLLETQIGSAYGGTDFKGPMVAQDIEGAPNNVQEPVNKGGEAFKELEYSVPIFDDEEIDEDTYDQMLEHADTTVRCYEEATNQHLDNMDAEELFDLDILIDEALAERGIVNEDDVYEMAKIVEPARDDLEEDQAMVRRQFKGTDLSQKLGEHGYEAEEIVKSDYQRQLGTITSKINQGLAEQAKDLEREAGQQPLDYEPEIR